MASSNRLPHSWLASTIADLQSIPVAPLDDGAKVWVVATLQNYYLSRTSGLTPDGVNIIAPSTQAGSGEPAAVWLSEDLIGQIVSRSASIIDDQVGLISFAVFANVPELTLGIPTGDGALDVQYDITGTATGGSASFRVLIDGVEASIGGTNVTRSLLPTGTFSAVASARIGGITAGLHTVVVQYKTNVEGSTLSIRPETEDEHGTLNVHFITPP
jgi:hypothetical protein